MESAGNGGHQLVISGAGGDQPLVMSAEDAAQFLAQAGLQLVDVTDSGGEQVIINSDDLDGGVIKVGNRIFKIVIFFGGCLNFKVSFLASSFVFGPVQ
jgi:hypothetical protein